MDRKKNRQGKLLSTCASINSATMFLTPVASAAALLLFASGVFSISRVPL